MCLLGGQRSRGLSAAGRESMALTNRLHHDVEVAQRATLTLSADFVLAAFVVLGVGVTVYDIGKWLAIW
jgi:hypothetical protein